MTALTKLGTSPEHAKYQSLLPKFWKRVKKQEADMIKLGLPAKGYYDFARKWFDAWAKQDVEQTKDCLTEDCSFIDASTFQEMRHGRDATLEFCEACYEAFPDIAFYPQDDSIRSLPYADYSEGQWRIVVPWRGVGRWTGEAHIPGTDYVGAPTGKCFNFIGIDRYTIEIQDDVWRISHIDTDYDIAYFAMQLNGIPLAAPGAMLRPALALQRLLVPTLRLVGRVPLPRRNGSVKSA